MFEAFLYSRTMNIGEIVYRRLGSERRHIYAYFIYRTLCGQSKTCGLVDLELVEIAEWKAANRFALAMEIVEIDSQ